MTTEAYKTTIEKLADLEAMVGQEMGLSNWVDITQEKINLFGKLTEDEQWIHVDPDMSAKHSPYKTTIAHGFMVLSLASRFAYDTMQVNDVVMGVNYGLDRVRFMNHTPVNSKLRGRVVLTDFETKERGARYKVTITFELDGIEKPACVAEFIAMAYTAG
ncbi:MAG: MaoC family dehydratase [Bacteroidota bacterium]